MDLPKIIQIILNLMRIIEKDEKKTGEEKKEQLFNDLKSILGESFKDHEFYINYILETIIFISKTHALSGINKNSFKCF